MGGENDLSFGKLALSKGYCTKAQLEDALRTLEEVRKLGLKEQLGNILVKKDVMKEAQVKDILRLQAKKSNVKIANCFTVRVFPVFQTLNRVSVEYTIQPFTGDPHRTNHRILRHLHIPVDSQTCRFRFAVRNGDASSELRRWPGRWKQITLTRTNVR